MTDKPYSIKAVLFDFDGTLTEPFGIDFMEIRKIIGCPENHPVLEFIADMDDPEEKKRANAVLEQFENQAAETAQPSPDAGDVIRFIRSRDLHVGIITRNNRRCVDRALKNFEDLRSGDFDIVISRDIPVRPKPHPDGVLLAAKSLNVHVSEILVVGDFQFDIQAGKNAGALTAFLDVGTVSDLSRIDADFTLSRLSDLNRIIRMGTPLPPGKFPNALLKDMLAEFRFDDPSVLINPGIGEDIAAVDVTGDEVVILKSDPITFATDAAGHYAVLVNANDIATSGATPRWFLTTLLFPPGATPSEIRHLAHELKTVCETWNITLCGGHTEITDAVTRPVISGMLAGTALKRNLIDKRRMETGDLVLMTKGAAVEGTSIIAREFGRRLMDLGADIDDIMAAKALLDDISITPEAAVAARFDGVTAMHDVTEGGAATALEELSVAGNHTIRVDMGKIPVLPVTENLCRLLGINPLGLIGSGSLLICCHRDASVDLMENIRAAGVDVAVIGEVTGPGQGVTAVMEGRRVRWPAFEADEITKLF